MTEALTLASIALTKLKPHPDNIRHAIPIDKGMVASIEAEGILEPLLVLPADAKGIHLVVAGHRRRLHALKAKGVTDVPCIIRDLTPLQVLTTMMVENLQRADVDPIEEASGYARMVELEATHASIAKEVGTSARHVKDRLALLQLPKAAIDFYRKPVGDSVLTLAGMAEALKYSGDTEAMDAWAAELGKTRARDWQATREPGRWLHQFCSRRDTLALRNKVVAEFNESGAVRFTKELGYDNNYRLDLLGKPSKLEHLKLGAKAKAHRDEPCHQVKLYGIEPDRWGNMNGSPAAVPICTAPLRHTTKGPEKDRSKLQMAAATYKDVPIKAQRNSSGKQGPTPKVKRAMTAARMDHLRKVVTGEIPLSHEQLVELALTELRHRTGEASDVLGRIVDPTLTKKGSGYSVGHEYMTDPANADKALALLCLAAMSLDTWSTTRLGLPAFLVSTGYTPVEGEERWLDADVKAYEAEVRKRDKAVAAAREKAAKAAAAAEPDPAGDPEQLATDPDPGA